VTERPLHVRVAEALGWSQIGALQPGWGTPPLGTMIKSPVGLSGYEQPLSHDRVPRYDTDWSATGPLIERFGIWLLYVASEREWSASAWHPDGLAANGASPLVAVCELILVLRAEGALAPIGGPLTANS
jgi:uncharacterized protein DUF2591